MKTNKTGIILLSGGLDSFVSLDMAQKICNIQLALTFNYGQKAFQDEETASKEISKYYKINQKTIELPFVKEVSSNALTNDNNDDFNNFNSVWIPDRNGLFLNIAAVWADKYKYDYIIFGANKEEGRDFPDNTEKFVELTNEYFKYATINHPKVLAPCIKLNKIEMVNYAIDNNLPLNLIKSCYKKTENSKKHCGKCMSCKLLYNAVKQSKKPELLGEIF